MVIIRIFFILFFFQFNPIHSQKIKWLKFEEAIEKQKSNPKKIIMDLYTSWCGPCKVMDKKTFGNKDVANYINKFYYAVKFNAEGNEEINFFDQKFINTNYDPNKNGRNATHEFTKFLKVEGYPTIVFFSEEGDPIMPVTGFQNVHEIELYLKMIKQGDYIVFKTSKDFLKYKKFFHPKFKD
jgi:thioredoxin-related protein